MAKRIPLAGKRFGSLLVIRFAGLNKWGQTLYHTKCDCGRSHCTSGDGLRRGVTKRCSFCGMCSQGGFSRSREYETWWNMKQRCLNPNHPQYENYGGRGITICARWMDEANGFLNFLADMGKRPKGKSIDRENVEDGYHKDNCRWATKKQQNNNKRNNYTPEELATLRAEAEASAKFEVENDPHMQC